MIKWLKQRFTLAHKEKRDFSSFFTTASPAEQRTLLETVVRQANQDQRAVLEKYERVHQKTA